MTSGDFSWLTLHFKGRKLVTLLCMVPAHCMILRTSLNLESRVGGQVHPFSFNRKEQKKILFNYFVVNPVTT